MDGCGDPVEDGEIGGLSDVPDPAAGSGGRPSGGISTGARSARRQAACAVRLGGLTGSADKVAGELPGGSDCRSVPIVRLSSAHEYLALAF